MECGQNIFCNRSRLMVGLEGGCWKSALSSNSPAAYPTARCVLRGRGGSDVALLPENFSLRGKRCFPYLQDQGPRAGDLRWIEIAPLTLHFDIGFIDSPGCADRTRIVLPFFL